MGAAGLSLSGMTGCKTGTSGRDISPVGVKVIDAHIHATPGG